MKIACEPQTRAEAEDQEGGNSCGGRHVMTDKDHTSPGLLSDQIFYIFLNLRKDRIRKVVEDLNTRYPAETSEQKARRLMSIQTPLSFLGGLIMHLPMSVPGVGGAFKAVGLVGATSVITRMHLYLILEIALLYGKDIDDPDRVPEMLAVIAATGLASAAPLLADLLGMNPLLSLPAAGIMASVAAQMIGEQAILFYSNSANQLKPAPSAQGCKESALI